MAPPTERLARESPAGTGFRRLVSILSSLALAIGSLLAYADALDGVLEVRSA